MIDDLYDAMPSLPRAEQVLVEAAGILADPAMWVKENYTWPPGVTTRSLERAQGYCSLGAIREVYRRHGSDFCEHDQSPAAHALLMILQDAGVGEDIIDWNDADRRVHSEVMEAFEKASAYAAEKKL